MKSVLNAAARTVTTPSLVSDSIDNVASGGVFASGAGTWVPCVSVGTLQLSVYAIVAPGVAEEMSSEQVALKNPRSTLNLVSATNPTNASPLKAPGVGFSK